MIVSNTTQLFIGLRRENGQIGYLSESLTIPEFFELIRPTEEKGSNLIDFSPVIEVLHSTHEKSVEQSIREKYNSVFNYWQESNSYSNLQIKLPKFENLSILSNELINSFQFKIDKLNEGFSHRRTGNIDKNLEVIRNIENSANAYIDVLLCFIHSKASLEIESFQKDVVLTQYCGYIQGIVSNLFNRVVEYSTWNNNFNLDDSSLLYYLAFSDNKEINYYTKLLPSFDDSQDLKLLLLKKSTSQNSHNYQNEQTFKIEVEYRNPLRQELEMARILRDLCYKIASVSKLIKRLQKGDVKWNPSEDLVEELKRLISNT